MSRTIGRDEIPGSSLPPLVDPASNTLYWIGSLCHCCSFVCAFAPLLSRPTLSKSTSLEQATRQALAKALTEAIYSLIRLLESAHDTIPPLFRDAWAAHVYFLYQFMFFLESELKASSKVPEILIATRQLTADAMKAAAQAMSRYRDVLWQRGVPEEAIVALPTRIAFPLLEIATGVLARKAACADQALQIIAVTVQGAESLLLNMVTAALMDLMHSFEHVAALAAELCTITADDTLGTELLREVARLESTSDPKSGIRFVAPFVALLAQVRPKLVWQHIAQLLPHLQSEPYNLRSAIVTAVGHILESLHRQEQTPSAEDNAVSDNTKDAIRKSKHALWDVLAERVYDISSYTRSAVLKVWIQLVQSHCLPKERHLIATRMAMDRVQDKTVIVRKQALQVSGRKAGNQKQTNKQYEDKDAVRNSIDACSYIALDFLLR